jgi:tRNA dimethylallyltransferase
MRVEIVSADSRQIYKYMDIGTAKPDSEELARVRHHFISILDPDEDYNAGRYSKEARETIKDIIDRGKTPLVVGGSGLYIKALIDGIFDSPQIDPAVRKKVLEELERFGVNYMYEKLKKVDAQYAAKISANDPQRITRALEVYLSSGIPLSQWHSRQTDKADFTPVMFGLIMDREALYERINRRVDEMFKTGLIDEVKILFKKGYNPDLNALNTVGYKEVFQYIDNRLSYDEALELIKQNSRNYAKRQLTWFKKDKRIHWLGVQEKELTILLEKIVNQQYAEIT